MFLANLILVNLDKHCAGLNDSRCGDPQDRKTGRLRNRHKMRRDIGWSITEFTDCLL